MRLYELGLYHLELEYWTEEQVLFLHENYKSMGDTEIAEVFTVLWPKKKGWSKKHIVKKRRYLNLKRTEIEIQKILDRNKQQGRYSVNHWKRWFNREAEIGTIRTWGSIQVIKTNSGWVHYAPFLWKENFGPIPTGFVVARKIKSKPVSVENLELISKGELARRNSIMNYPEDLRKAIFTLASLKRKIVKYEEQD